MGDWASSHLGQGGKGVAYWQAGHFQGAGVPRPTCSPRLTPGQTSPRSSGNSFHHSRHCLNLQSRPTASSWAPPKHLLLPKGQPGNPLSKHNLPPLLPKNVAWSSACAQLWLLTARSAAAAPRCQDLFRERAGGAKTRWAEEEEEEGARTYWSIGGQPSSSLHPTLPNCPLHTCLANVQPVKVLLTYFNPVRHKGGGRSGPVLRKGVYP